MVAEALAEALLGDPIKRFSLFKVRVHALACGCVCCEKRCTGRHFPKTDENQA